ncbi:MAG TPA: hypothetical protein VFW14_16910 [Gaiellales bacterium]|jgi:hypothetical protein|nr:hypothetical protein [Gaiellales bacterium]
MLSGGCLGSAGTAASTSAPAAAAVRLVSLETPAVDDYRLRMGVPASWRRYRTGCVSSFTATMVNIGMGEMHPLGSRTSNPSPGVTRIVCGPPIGHLLAPGAVAVTWTAGAFPRPVGESPLARVPGRLVRRPDGWFEKIHVGGGRGCPQPTTDETITAVLAAPWSRGYSFDMQACLRGPGLALHRREVLSMVRSTRFVRSR